MNKPITTPNLPQSNVSLAVIGEGHERVAVALEHELQIALLYSKANISIDRCAANHADMAVHCTGGGTVVADCSQTELITKLRQQGATVVPTERPVSGAYPADVALNCVSIGGRLLCREDAVSERLREAYEKKGVLILNVKQGYTKCSTLPIGENAVITDDETIFKACMSLKLDCLKISRGDIYLDGVHEGFIGGSGFMLNKKTAVFFGELSTHKDGKKISDFLKRHGVDFVELTEGQLQDIGGVVSICEKAELMLEP